MRWATQLMVLIAMAGAVAGAIYAGAALANAIVPDSGRRLVIDAGFTAVLVFVIAAVAAWTISNLLDLSFAGNCVLAAAAIVPAAMAGARAKLRAGCGLPPDGKLIAVPHKAPPGMGEDIPGWVCAVFTSPFYPIGVLALVAVAAAGLLVLVERPPRRP